MLQTLLYKIITSRKLRYFLSLFMLVFLAGCSDDGDEAMGEDGNYSTQANCWQVKIMDATLGIINKLYKSSSEQVAADSFATGGAGLICISFAIWLAFKILKILPSFKEENLGEIWTEIGQKLAICMFCAIIVSQTNNITWAITTFVIPIYTTLLELGLRILDASGTEGLAQSSALGEYGTVEYTHDYSTCAVSNIEIDSLKEGISPMAGCLICAISDRLNTGIKIGVALICTLRISGILVGITMLLLFIAAKFSFVLFIIDSLFRLNFVAFLMPIMIIGVPFAYTRKWSKHCFLMFLNSAGILMFMALLITLAVGAMEYIVGQMGGNFSQTSIEGMGPMLLALFMLALLLVNIPGMGVALADRFIGGGGGLEFQKKISKFVINLAKKTAAKILSSISSSATQSITDAMEKYEKVREVFDTMKQIKNKTSSQINSLAGYNDD